MDKLTDYLKSTIDAGEVPSLYALVSKKKRPLYSFGAGKVQEGLNKPPSETTIYRGASMTKAITAVAVMQLVEAGKLSLQDPLAKIIPAFTGLEIFAVSESGEESTSPTPIAPTIHHLLTHTSGITYGWFGPEELDAKYQEKELNRLFLPTSDTLEQRIDQLATLPLKFTPGEMWDYSLSYDVLGRVIEIVSGQSLYAYFDEHILSPLGMVDTHFEVPQEKANRLTELYTFDADENLEKVPPLNRETGSGTQRDFLEFSSDYITEGNANYHSAGSGLCTTAADYFRFLQMLLNKGVFEGHRILSPDTIDLMCQNHTGDFPIYLEGHGSGYGYGFGVVTEKDEGTDPSNIGSISWGGIFNTYYWVDPKEELIGILMTQVFPFAQLPLRADFKRLVYKNING
ncbi:serine hydrolase domain-containing protein [Pelagicoccus mobilis]|uniref:Beta-lactamase family protein n=1 Tax=Pelagicoccus mobilis TaxID=415221 RepID=A0A934VMP8_9BACT|nr:serine hydrolase domain-containing protein [Pelagicoccus mobilis]MBK1879081.1 beta-lactamase family protein [Pelagicoccus mobilis]